MQPRTFLDALCLLGLLVGVGSHAVFHVPLFPSALVGEDPHVGFPFLLSRELLVDGALQAPYDAVLLAQVFYPPVR